MVYGDTNITLTRSHVLRFSSGFYKTNSLKNYKYVILFYDKANEAIGFQFTNISTKGAFKISTEKTNSGGYTSIVSFLKANNIDPYFYHGKYEWHKEFIPGIGETFVVDLKINEDAIPF